jgi:hypothetical protein
VGRCLVWPVHFAVLFGRQLDCPPIGFAPGNLLSSETKEPNIFQVNWKSIGGSIMETADSFEVGSRVPEFRLPASTGDEIGIADYEGKSNLILFFVREYG